jgi:glycosyltransferase involved in cell wall biosynthesis
MKVLHVVTLHSVNNAFRGPVQVALNLAKELRAQGSSVVLLAGSSGLPNADYIEGVPCHLYPLRSIHSSLGFSGMYSWDLWIWAWRNVRSFDVIHVHLARDLVTLPVGLIAMIRGIPFVIQTHGMIDSTNKILGRILDALATRRLLLRADRLLYLTHVEESDLKEVSRNRHADMTRFSNGVPQSCIKGLKEVKYISFISRLQERKHPELFVQMASILGTKDSSYEFRIAGPDEGKLSETLEAISSTNLGKRISYVGALDHAEVLGLLSETKVLVLPSINEPWGMIVLEALSKSVPVVITKSCGVAPYISRSEAGIVVSDGSAEQLALAVQTILDDFETYSNAALRLSMEVFSMTQIVKQLNDIYRCAAHHQLPKQSA